jgi:hypothetical protein
LQTQWSYGGQARQIGPPMTARLVSCVVFAGAARLAVAAQSDLDTFMQQVLAHRDDNWKKLQQYVLDERETMEVRGPAQVSLWGERSDYTWYVRDGFFVRSPLKVNGVTISEADRRKYEAEFLRREQERDKKAKDGTDQPGPAAAAPSVDDAPRDVDGLIKQTQQPRFISSAYFLRFRFDQGRYALVGREKLEDHDVMRIEYYPTNLFADEQRGRDRTKDEPDADQMRRLMNKTSRVTLWIEPTSQQILKYTFDDLGWEFFPGQWLVRISKVTASMSVGQPFPGVWLPRSLEMDIGFSLAVGPVDLHYALDYHDYRRADVTSKIGIPGVS